MPNYERGTDLLNCPRECYSFRYDTYPMGAELSCLAKPADTCPREQAEKVRPDRTCTGCLMFYDCLGHTQSRQPCSNWTERTNG